MLLDELDKSAGGGSRRDVDPVAQLHGALEPETARCLTDISVEVEFDASLVSHQAGVSRRHWRQGDVVVVVAGSQGDRAEALATAAMRAAATKGR